MRASWKSIVLISVVAALLVASGGCTDGSGAGATVAPVPVVVASASLTAVPLVIEAPATLHAVGSVAVRARVDGEVLSAGFEEGTDVTAGQVLFRIDPRPFEALLAEARATLAKDEAVLARDRAQRKRYGELLAQGYVSADDYAQLIANLRTAEAAVAGDLASVQAAELNLAYCAIRAPISGRTGVMGVRPGNLVRASDGVVLVTVTQMDPVFVDFSVPQSSLADLRRGLDRATIRIADGDEPWGHESRLDFIDNTVDTTTGTIHVRGAAANQDGTLLPGEIVRARLEIADMEQSVVVPASAVGTGPDGDYVFVVAPGGRARQQKVVVGRQTPELAVITSGVRAGDPVVTDGQSRLKDGMPVVVVPAGGHA
jgi:multidrug efflux system membrane fusion protein